MRDSTAHTTADPARLMPGELDALHRGIGLLTHYELLGVSATADRVELRDAHALLRKRLMSEPLGQGTSGQVRSQIGAVVAAVDEAVEVLLDPARKSLYDKYVVSRRPSQPQTFVTVPTAAPSPSPMPSPMPSPSPMPTPTAAPVTIPPPPYTRPLAPMPAPAAVQGFPQAPVTVVSVTKRSALDLDENWPLVEEAVPKVEVLPTLSRHTAPTAGAEYRMTPSRQMMDSPRTTKTTGAMLSQSGERNRWGMPNDVPFSPEVMFDATRREFDVLALAVEMCLDELSERRSPRADAMRAAASTLSSIRASHAAYAARLEEQAGRWKEAADQWRRAVDAQPANAHYALATANAYLRSGGDLDAAEHFALLSRELGGNADAALSEVATRRGR